MKKGSHLTKGHKEKIGKANTGKKRTEETIEKMKKAWTSERREEQGQRMTGDKNPNKRPEAREKQRQRMTGDKNPMYEHNYGPICRKCGESHGEHSRGMLGKENKWGHQSEYQKENQSNFMTEKWQDPEFVKKVFKGLLKRPTKLESRGYDFLHKYLFPYIYCGDKSFLIGGLNPDYREENGKKKCIEIANIKFYKARSKITTKEEYEQQRITHFKKYGWKCLVIWEDELADEEQLVKKVKEFTNI